MKKCIAILITILLFINSGGFIIIFYQLQKSAKEEMLLSIRNNDFKIKEIIKFRINKEQLYRDVNGFIWKEKNEFEYNERLYDIINIDTESESLVLSCLNDITEERIVKTFNNELNDLACGKFVNSKIKTSLRNLISQALIKSSFKLSQSSDQQIFHSGIVGNILPDEREILTPPPKHL